MKINRDSGRADHVNIFIVRQVIEKRKDKNIEKLMTFIDLYIIYRCRKSGKTRIPIQGNILLPFTSIAFR